MDVSTDAALGAAGNIERIDLARVSGARSLVKTNHGGPSARVSVIDPPLTITTSKPTSTSTASFRASADHSPTVTRRSHH